MKYLIRSGRVIDPANKIDGIFDVLIENGRIKRVSESIDEKRDEEIDARGKIVVPGLIDMHTHTREPGREDKETIGSASRAAIRGGYTTIACMPNTDPAIDNVRIVDEVKSIIKRDSLCNSLIIAAITEKREGVKITDIASFKRSGVCAVSDDGSSISDTATMEKALEACRKAGMLLIAHCEDTRIASGGVMNKGFISTKLGLRGMPDAAEYEIVKRDTDLAEKTGASVHIAHVSCKGSVDIIRKAKAGGVKVSAETAPHYFSLTEDCCVTYDTNTKMNPPLRAKADMEAIIAGIKDGTLDVIATDHAPHTDSEKDVEFDNAPFGIIGLETALSISVMELVDKHIISWSDLIDRMSLAPAKILGLDKGVLTEGKIADITIIDPDKEYIYEKSAVVSKSKNSPFIGWRLKARAEDVFVGGRLVMRSGRFI